VERRSHVEVRRWRYAEGAVQETEDWLATEEGLEVRINHRPFTVLMRTPGNDEELATGFLVTEGIVRAPGDLLGVHVVVNPTDPHRGHIVDTAVAPETLARANVRDRSFFASSACGVCGRTRLEDLALPFGRVESPLRISRRVLGGLPEALRKAQPLFERTGGLHGAALFTTDGALLAAREDVGRHNAVDKVVGWAYREKRLPLSDAVLLVSGRAGYDILQKAVAAGIPVVAAIGAPSSYACRLAQDHGVTLVGFLRADTLNVYTHPDRVTP